MQKKKKKKSKRYTVPSRNFLVGEPRGNNCLGTNLEIKQIKIDMNMLFLCSKQATSTFFLTEKKML